MKPVAFSTLTLWHSTCKTQGILMGLLMGNDDNALLELPDPYSQAE
jgi:hypothetical protein